MQNLLNDLKTVLEQDSRFLTDGKILKNAVIEAALKPDAALIRLLLGSDVIRSHFFLEVDGTLVFDKVKFQDFVSNKQFLPNSYTAFKNKLGLFDRANRSIAGGQDVVLNWAYKECVLEGGMTKEEAGRNEIFYNTVLAPDEITRLTDPKVLTKFAYWDAEAVRDGKAKPVTSIQQSENLLIKGNNLLALHCLKKRYAGRVKLIYIDPPYNTGGDSFRYNDSFNHSSWLTFMKNRLDIAKLLLSENGSIFVNIDDKEFAYLQVLLDDVFSRENYVSTITVKRSGATGHKTINPSPVNVSDYILVYAKNKKKWTYRPQYVERVYDKQYSQFIENYDAGISKWKFISIKDVAKRENLEVHEVAEKYPRQVVRFAEPDLQGVGKETRELVALSEKEPSKIFIQKRNDYADIYILNGSRILFYIDKMKEIDGKLVTAEPITTIWEDIGFQGIAKEGGIELKKGKKPERLLRRILDMSTERDDLVLDFFAGSGTTAAVSHKLGRRWIAVEQMNYIKDLPEQRIKNVVRGEQTGISKSVDWQGGGDFIYCEIMEWNERYIQDIRAAKTTQDLLDIYARMREEAFFRYDVDLSAYEGKDFAALEFTDQQKALIACLEMNHLYVNYSEIEDKTYAVPEDEKKLNRQFYGDGGES